MRKFFLLTAAIALLSTTAYAGMPVGSFALGWVDSEAPIGIRYQFAEKVAGDLGIGFASYDGGNTEIKVHCGLPFELIGGDRCWLDFRPGFSLCHTSYDADIDATNDMALHGWLTVHVLMTENFGVNASHGLDIVITDGGDADNTTDFMTSAANVTSLGWFFWF